MANRISKPRKRMEPGNLSKRRHTPLAFKGQPLNFNDLPQQPSNPRDVANRYGLLVVGPKDVAATAVRERLVAQRVSGRVSEYETQLATEVKRLNVALQKARRQISQLKTENDLLKSKQKLNAQVNELPVISSKTTDALIGALPIDDVNPQEAIDLGLVNMSVSNLYRAAESGRFYFLTPTGKTNGRVFPAWQFINPVPDLLPELLSELRMFTARDLHRFFVSSRNELNELSPAEMIAGLAFKTRFDLGGSQLRLLRLPTATRLARVKDIIKLLMTDDNVE